MNIDWPSLHKAAPLSHWVTIDRYGVIMAHSMEPKFSTASGTWSSGLFPSPVKLGMSPVGSDFQANNCIFHEPGYEPKPVDIPAPKPEQEGDDFMRAQNLIARRYGDDTPGDRLTGIAISLSKEAQSKAAQTQPTGMFTVDPTKPAVQPQQFNTAIVQLIETLVQHASFGPKQAEVQKQLAELKALVQKL
jgi:hypothetical protein